MGKADPGKHAELDMKFLFIKQGDNKYEVTTSINVTTIVIFKITRASATSLIYEIEDKGSCPFFFERRDGRWNLIDYGAWKGRPLKPMEEVYGAALDEMLRLQTSEVIEGEEQAVYWSDKAWAAADGVLQRIFRAIRSDRSERSP